MPAQKTARRSIAMTPQMRARLQQLVDQQPGDITEADLIRAAIRDYLDRQEDVIGSRAHFRKSFRDRIDALQDEVEFLQHILIALLAHGLAVMLPVFTEQPVTTIDLIQAAIVAAQRERETLRSAVEAVREP